MRVKLSSPRNIARHHFLSRGQRDLPVHTFSTHQLVRTVDASFLASITRELGGFTLSNSAISSILSRPFIPSPSEEHSICEYGSRNSDVSSPLRPCPPLSSQVGGRKKSAPKSSKMIGSPEGRRGHQMRIV
jgi:hypothetical protein